MMYLHFVMTFATTAINQNEMDPYLDNDLYFRLPTKHVDI